MELPIKNMIHSSARKVKQKKNDRWPNRSYMKVGKFITCVYLYYDGIILLSGNDSHSNAIRSVFDITSISFIHCQYDDLHDV